MDNHLFQNDMGGFGLVSPVRGRRGKQIPCGEEKKKGKSKNNGKSRSSACGEG
jgi:hypothetical protein